MEKEELIRHWMTIVSAVFYAEDNIKEEWFPKLEIAKVASSEEKKKVADAYLRAIAEEIINNGYSEEGSE